MVTEARKFATLAQFKDLQMRKKQGRLGKTFLSEEMWLSNWQARELGYDVAEGESFLLVPGELEEGQLYGRLPVPGLPGIERERIRPVEPLRQPGLEAPEIQIPSAIVPVEDPDVVGVLQRLYPELFDPTRLADVSLAEGIDPIESAVQEIERRIAESPEEFLDDLISKGRTDDSVALLRALEFTDADIDALFTYGDVPEEGQDFIYEVDIKGVTVRKLGNLAQDGLVRVGEQVVGAVDLRTGEFFSLKQLRKMAMPSDDEMRETLRTGQVPEDEIDKIIALSKENLSAEGWLDKYKEINQSFRKDAFLGITSRAIGSALGGIVAAGGGFAGWAKQETVRQNFLDVAKVLQSSSPEMVGWHGPETLIDPRFWQTTVASTLTFSIALIPAGIMAAYAGAQVAGGLGIGAFGTKILILLFGATGRGLTEAAFESGSVYNEAKALDFTDEDAGKAAASVYWKNAATLTAMSIPEFAFAFGVNPFRGTLTRMFNSGLVRVGRFGVPALTEGGQEFLQDIYTRQALGRPIEWDDEAKLAVVLGAILGIGVGAGGNAFTMIQSKVKSRLTPELQEIFDTEKDRLTAEGLSPEGAELRAMDAVAETEEGKTLIDDIAEEIRESELERVIQPEDKVEGLALDHVRREAEIERVIPPEVEVRPPVEAVVPEVLPSLEIQRKLTTTKEELSQNRRALRDLEKQKASETALQIQREGIKETEERVKGLQKQLREVVAKPPAPPTPVTEPVVAPEAVPEEVRINALERELIATLGREISFRNDLTWKQSMSYLEQGVPNLIIGTKGATESEVRFVAYHEWAHLIASTEGLQVLTPEQSQEIGGRLARDADAWLWAIGEFNRKGLPLTEVSLLIPDDIKTLSVVQEQLPKPPVTPEVKPVEVPAEPPALPVEEIVPTKPPLPPGLKIPIGELSTAELQKRVKTASPHVKLYQVELDRRIPPAIREKSLEILPEIKPEELALSPTGEVMLTDAQRTRSLELFGKYVMSRTALDAFELTQELRRETRAGQAKNLKVRAQELIVEKGLPAEAAMKQAISETLSGKLPVVTTEYLDNLTQQMRDVLFHEIAVKMKNYPFEMASTHTALLNALPQRDAQGKLIRSARAIPRDKGKSSILFPQGGSAWDRLNFVFGDKPQLIQGLGKMAKEGETLHDVVEGIFHEIGREPGPPLGLFEEPFPPELFSRIFGQEAMPLLEMSERKPIVHRTKEQIAQDTLLLRLELAKPPEPVGPTKVPFDAPIEKAFRQPPMFNFMERSLFNKVLKELLMSPLDIGNFLRANKASFDNSFLRQSKALAGGHPLVGWQAHTTAWQSMFSQKHTEAEWQLITQDPDFQIYDQIRVDTGHDPLRVPAFAATKGTEQYRTSEEFGFTRQDVERAIPRFTAWLPHVKYSERAFSAGTNKIVWGVWKQKLKFARRYSEKIASGEVTLRAGESFDIIQEMTEQQAMLGNMIQRANLRRFSGLAPAMNAFFFAARSKIGRFLVPIHLTGLSYSKARGVTFNPRVMKEAWRDFLLTNAEIAGIMFLGSWLGLWDLEKDPRNAEFMSARIGKTRIDPWAGQRQFVVLYARLVTKTGISSVTGAEYDINPERAVQSFVRNSLSPLASILLEFWTGRNFLGQLIDFADGKYWIEKITPFAINDIWEAAEEDWRTGVAVAIPAVYGEGVQTYTGDWEDNFSKLGLPKYIENTAYGINEPYYDTADFWGDTTGQFKGVDPATLTEAKGFPEYIRAIVEAKIIKEDLMNLPNERLVSLNADPSLDEPTFTEFREMWAEREKLVAAGDDAEYTIKGELQPDGKRKDVTYKGEDAVIAFDKINPGAEKGNFSQRQFSLLMQYHSITDEAEQREFLEKHKDDIGVRPRDEWLRSNWEENAQLAVWGQAKILTREAYTEFNRLIKALDIPDNAIPKLLLPPETSIDTHFAYEELVSDKRHSSAEAKLLLAKDAEAAEKAEVQSYIQWRTEQGNPLRLSDSPIPALELKVKNRELTEERDELETDEERETWDADHTEWLDDQERVKAYENNGEEFVEQWVERGRVSDEFGGSSVQANVWYLDNMEAYRWAFDNELMADDGGFPDDDPRIKDGRVNDKWNIPVKRIKANEEFERLDNERNAWSDPESGLDVFIPADATIVVDGEEVNKRQWTLDKQYEDNPDFHDDMRRIEVFSKDVTDSGTVEGYVTYMRDVVDVHGANGWQAFLARHRNAKVNDFLVNEKGLDLLDLDNLPIWEFEEKWETEEIAYQDILDNNEGTVQTAKTKAYLAENLDYHKARRRIDALKIDFPIERVDNYVTWFTDPALVRPSNWINKEGTDLPWYEDDWFLIDNPEFLKAMIKAEVWEKRRDFRLVPMTEDGKSDRVVGALYLEYKRIVNNQSARDLLRLNNPNLDKWGVSVGIWTRTMSEKRRRLGLTATERFLEEAAEARGRIR